MRWGVDALVFLLFLLFLVVFLAVEAGALVEFPVEARFAGVIAIIVVCAVGIALVLGTAAWPYKAMAMVEPRIPKFSCVACSFLALHIGKIGKLLLVCDGDLLCTCMHVYASCLPAGQAGVVVEPKEGTRSQ